MKFTFYNVNAASGTLIIHAGSERIAWEQLEAMVRDRNDWRLL